MKDKKKNGPAEVATFVDKLAKRELTLEALPASLRMAINDMSGESKQQ